MSREAFETSVPFGLPRVPFLRPVADGEGVDLSDPRLHAALRPVRDLIGKNDPIGLVPATATVLRRALRNPKGMLRAYARLGQGTVRLQVATAAKAVGVPTDPVIPADPKDRRFREATWSENPAFFSLQQSYLMACRFVEDVLHAGASSDPEDLDDRKAAFLVGLVLESLSPINFPATNPEAMIRGFQTGGRSYLQGFVKMLDDYVERGGLPQQVDTSGFELGENIAVTPGKVIYRNELIELIQYAPQTDKVQAVPILCSPPWINKFYVMDLSPGRSLIEWMVQHKRTVFVISYRDPGHELSHLRMDDYLEKGFLTALDVVEEVTGAPKIDVVGLCLGGAMATIGVTHLAATGDKRVNSLTTLNTLVDYSEPGELGIFVDDQTVQRIKGRMRDKGGVLPAKDMATTFDLLRARDLVFRYVPTRWLMGEESPAFDVLAWNADSVRMPATMHTEYLESLYWQNRLARGEYVALGERLDLKDLTVDTYVVGAINDHIVPWKSSFGVVGLTGGKVRYVLSNGGHIAGVVNPPGPKAWHHVLPKGEDDTTGPAETWLEQAPKTAGSWWEDWTAWSKKRAGRLVEPPPMGSEAHPPVGDAPGEYVR